MEWYNYDNATNLIIFFLLIGMIGMTIYSLFSGNKIIHFIALFVSSLVIFLSFLFSVIAINSGFVNFFDIMVYSAVIGLALLMRYFDMNKEIADEEDDVTEVVNQDIQKETIEIDN